MLTLTHLTHRYPRSPATALADLTLTLSPGVYGILGPNGSGKTTLMNIITDNLTPTSGEVAWNGTPIRKLGRDYRELLGYMPQHQGVYDDFTANRFLWYMSTLKGLKKSEAAEKIDRLLTLVNLRDDAHRRMGAFSGGMKQRILIAQALLNDPKLLILDEPTAGLDPKERIRIRNFISSIASDKIVLLATHVVGDVECIAREILLLKRGVLVTCAPTSQLIEDVEGKVWQADIPPERVGEISGQYLVSNLAAATGGLIAARVISETVPELPGVHPVRPTLEDVYLYHFSDTDETVHGRAAG